MINDSKETITKKKRFLRRYRKNKACIYRLEEKLFLLNERINKIKSPNFSSMPRGGTPPSMAELITDKTDLEARIERLKRKGLRFKNEILEEIDSLEDSKYCDILELFYIDCFTFEEIGDKLGYTERHVGRLHKQALELLANNNEPISQ